MSDVYFTTNPNEFAQLEGLYVSERNPPGFIRGVDLSTTGIFGKCVRGPVTPTEISSSGEFLDIFGGRDYGSGGALVGEVWAALLNKPFGKLVIRRVVAADAVPATKNLANAVPTTIAVATASSEGAWGNNITIAVEDATDGEATHWNARVSYLGREVVYQNLNTTTGNDNLAAVVGSSDSRFVTLTKSADGRPINAVAASLATGSEGTLAVGDFEDALDDLAAYPGIAIVTPAGAVAGSAATYHSHLVTVAAEANDRNFLTWAMAHGQDWDDEITQMEAQITTRSDRIWWCFNSAYTVDPETDAEIQRPPTEWMAGLLSQIDVDVHPGSFETVQYLAGISKLTTVSLNRTQLKALRAAGISTLENNTDGPQFRSAVTTDLTAGKTEITRRRMVDFLQLSASSRLRYYVKRKNTAEVRAGMAGELTAFSSDLKDKTRVVEDFEIDSESVNTANQRAQGEEHLLWRVKLIGHILALVLETDISTGTIIERS